MEMQDETKMVTIKHCYNEHEALHISLLSKNDEYDSLADNTSSGDSWSDSDVENDEISNEVFIIYTF